MDHFSSIFFKQMHLVNIRNTFELNHCQMKGLYCTVPKELVHNAPFPPHT